MTIIAAADGSALGNPGPAGWCWYVDADRWQAGGWPRGTNNMGELTAVLELFRATSHLDDDLLVLCDSRYVIDAVTAWMPGWKRRGWRKADGSPVLNLEIMQALDTAVAGRRYRFEWVKGHSGHELNEAADERARAAATAFSRGDAPDTGPGLAGSSSGSPTAPVAGIDSGVIASAAADQSTLFDLDAPAREVTVSLDDDTFQRLVTRARQTGRTPEQYLRDLV